MNQPTRRTDRTAADLDTVVDRLQQIDQQLDRQLTASLARVGLTVQRFFELRRVAEVLGDEQRADAERVLERELPVARLSWEAISRPELSSGARERARIPLLRA